MLLMPLRDACLMMPIFRHADMPVFLFADAIDGYAYTPPLRRLLLLICRLRHVFSLAVFAMLALRRSMLLLIITLSPRRHHHSVEAPAPCCYG